jgi:hypothetical protein
MKTCSLCLLPRPDSEPVCAICDNDEFSEVESGAESGGAVRLLVEGRFDLAYRSLEEEIARGREDGPTALGMAWLAFAFRDLRAVETWCHEAIRLQSDSPEPHLLLGLVLLRGERWLEAVEEFGSGLEKPELTLERRALLETLCAAAASRIPEW